MQAYDTVRARTHLQPRYGCWRHLNLLPSIERKTHYMQYRRPDDLGMRDQNEARVRVPLLQPLQMTDDPFLCFLHALAARRPRLAPHLIPMQPSVIALQPLERSPGPRPEIQLVDCRTAFDLQSLARNYRSRFHASLARAGLDAGKAELPKSSSQSECLAATLRAKMYALPSPRENMVDQLVSRVPHQQTERQRTLRYA
jgi:hypothetical protein